MLGAGLGALKYMLLVGIAIHFIEFVDSKDNLIKSTVKRTSLLYYPIEGFSGVFFPTVKNVTKQLID
jgi:membrane protein required for colicin V production